MFKNNYFPLFWVILLGLMWGSCVADQPVDNYGYTFSIQATSSNKLGMLIPSSEFNRTNQFSVNSSGSMNLTYINVNDTLSFGLFKILLDSLIVAQDGKMNEYPATAKIRTELANGVEVVFRHGATISGVIIPDTISSMAVNLIVGILSEFQFSADKNTLQSVNKWEIIETDGIGTYPAHYSLLSGEGNVKVFEKIKDNYLSNSNSYGFKRDVIFKSTGTAIIRIIEDNPLQMTVNGKSIQQQFDKSDTLVSTISEVKIDYTGRFTPDEALAKRYKKNVLSKKYDAHNWVALNKLVSPKRIERERDIQILGNDSFQDLLSLYQQINNDRESVNQQKLFRKTIAYIRLYPNETAQLEQFLRSQSPDKISWEPLCHAFIRSGSPRALSFIGKYMQDNLSNRIIVNKILILIALSDSTTPELEENVRGLLYEPQYAYSAQLTLGAIAGKCKEYSPDRSHRIVELLMPILNQQQDTIQTLLVLGNIGTPETGQMVQEMLFAWHSIELSSLSIRSLRSVPGPVTDSLLFYYAQHSPNNEIKNAALETIEFRKNLVNTR